MEAIEFVMKNWGIQEKYRSEVEDVLKNTPPCGIGLSLAMISQHSDDEDYDPEIDLWMEENFPGFRVC